MQVHIFLGWHGETKYNVLKKLKVSPETYPFAKEDKDEFDVIEFCESDEGILYIQQKLDIINNNFNTKFEWRMYADETLFLVWRQELSNNIGDPNDPPIDKYLIDYDKGTLWNLIATTYDITDEPVLLVITDASEFYHNYLYDL